MAVIAELASIGRTLHMTYDTITSVVEGAGFFTAYDSDSGRVICAALRRPDGGLSGNSFWIAQRSGEWFLGTWGPRFYHIPDSERAADLCVAWLRRQSGATTSDVDEHIRREFGLLVIEDLPKE